MSALPKKIHSFLEQLKDKNAPSVEEQKKAALLLEETLREKNIYLRKQSNDLTEAVIELKTGHNTIH